jgi:large subunit ribosomal protein L29
MELDKIRNLSDGELKTEETKAAEQLFRLRFQMKLGQNEGVKKLRGLKKDIARIKTIARERELGLHGETPKAEASVAVSTKKAAKAPAKTRTAKAKTTKEAR